MRLNQYLAKHTKLSRRSADEAISGGRIAVNNQPAELGQTISPTDTVTLDDALITPLETTTIMLHKPVKTICSSVQQGNVPTVYSLLPEDLQHLSYLGRLDKDTSGLLIMSNDGELIQAVSHPSHEVTKQYNVTLDKPLKEVDEQQLSRGVELDDGLSRLSLAGKGSQWTVTIHEGRNRQIRRSFEALGYEVTKLHRFKVGNLALGDVPVGQWRSITREDVV